MARVVVDTDVFSFVFKGDSRAALYQPHLTGNQLYVSFATVAELYRWSIKHNWGARRVASLVAALHNYTVLPFDDATAWHWARTMSIPGSPIGHGDAWVAAAALRHAMPLVTHNRKHFSPIPGLAIISES
jgi:tRNA(fMet)-specific endonuclease VapC